MTALVVLDFDGTMTDAEVEGRPFVAGFLADVAQYAQQPLATVERLAAQFEQQVLAEPESYGWRCQGQIVCPAMVDPYQRLIPVTEKLLDQFSMAHDPVERTRLLEEWFRQNYAKTTCAFRAYAGEALRALAPYDTYVVTNAHIEPVKNKIRQLNADGALNWLLERVVGRAQKNVVGPYPTEVPSELRLPGLNRPILPRRPHYHAVLEQLRAGRPWSEVTVLGDIFELDLALPWALGANVVLVGHSFTPPWERAFVTQAPRARLIESLAALPVGLGNS